MSEASTPGRRATRPSPTPAERGEKLMLIHYHYLLGREVVGFYLTEDRARATARIDLRHRPDGDWWMARVTLADDTSSVGVLRGQARARWAEGAGRDHAAEADDTSTLT